MPNVESGNFACVSSAMWFHDSHPSLGSGQSIYPNCMLNRTVPGEFLEINQCFLHIHIVHRFQHPTRMRRRPRTTATRSWVTGQNMHSGIVSYLIFRHIFSSISIAALCIGLRSLFRLCVLNTRRDSIARS